MKQQLKEAREHRACSSNDYKDQMIEIDSLIKDKIFKLLPKKRVSACYCLYRFVASSGTASQLFKRDAKLHRKKLAPKKYTANLDTKV